jgi:drug/metabolite transporter (DMT)-like permease
VSGSLGWGDVLVLAGVFSFVLYGLGAAQFRDFSPLRYTTLTAALGWIAIAAATAVGLASGLVPAPSPGAMELAGAGLTLTALVANNLVSRRSSAMVGKRYEELLEAA